MPTTKDRDNLGKTRWTATICRRFPDKPAAEILSGSRQDRAGIVRWVKANLPVWSRYDVFAEIRTGTWVDNTFDDPGFGHILDAAYEEADQPRAYCRLVDGDVDIAWED